MALPIKTTADDVRGIVAYLKNKATGATVAEAKAAVSKLVDGRKLSAYRTWWIVERDGERYKLTQRGWDLARRPEAEQATFRQIIDSITPYRSALEWAYHQKFDHATAVDVASHWYEHHPGSLDSDAKDATIRENAISFFHLCEGAGLGRLTVGRGGNPTRLTIDRRALQAYVEAGPSVPPTEARNGEVDDLAGEGTSEPAEVTHLHDNNGQIEELVAPTPPETLRAFISHGDNAEIVEQVQTVLGLADIESEIAEAEETPAIPVPDKVLDAMRRCQIGVISVSAEERSKNEKGEYIVNQNVLIEIGAAFVLYERRVVLLWDTRLSVPSNLQGLYRCEYEGDELTGNAVMKLMKAIQQFKK